MALSALCLLAFVVVVNFLPKLEAEFRAKKWENDRT